MRGLPKIDQPVLRWGYGGINILTRQEKGLADLANPLEFTGAPGQTRTGDTGIRNPLLYPLLSYGGVDLRSFRIISEYIGEYHY
jgi:hypothetical protein